MSDPICITYSFDFDDGRDKTFVIKLDRESLNYLNDMDNGAPDWADLTYQQCSNCPLSQTGHKYCPVAYNLVNLTEKFSSIQSHENVFVSVVTEDRTYKKRTTIDEALSSLMGIIMVTSGCPVLDHFKPMVRFHLPFASAAETTFRSLSMFLLAKFLLHKESNSHSVNFDMDEFENIFTAINEVNNDFSGRLRAAGEKDANLSALANLDCNATLVSLTIEETLNQLREYYTAYLKT